MKEIQLHRIDLNLLVVFEALMVEGSVAGAAAKLNKTPSAVSHALARLRDQVGDPLMVKVGGAMQASPFAVQLIEDVQPILRSIKRVLELPEPFDPATSDRVFRIACPASTKLLSEVAAQIQSSAPGVKLEWLAAPREIYSAVSEGLVDMAHLGGDRRLPDGLEEAEMPPLNFVSFVRQGHPALADWGPDAWKRHTHVQVAIGNEVRSPVDTASESASPDRHVGALISEFSSVGPLVAKSDFIATLPTIILAWDMARYSLQPLPPVVPVPPFRARFFWSKRTANDPALSWIRDVILGTYALAHEEAEAMVKERLNAGA